jgi:putative salt-induced outer membrane protein
MRYLALAASLFMMSPLTAQENAEEAAGPWSGDVTLGYLATAGNTENTSLNSGFSIGYATGKWVHGLNGIAINATQSGDATAESYVLGWKTEYNFSATNFAFGRVDWRKDRFSGYDQQVSQTVGYGRRILDTAAHVLNVEIGGGARQLDLADGTSENDGIVRGGLDYTWQFSESAQFRQDLIVESGKTNTFLESISAVKATLVGDLALVASYTIRNNSDVPIGTEKTDTFTALSLEYGF